MTFLEIQERLRRGHNDLVAAFNNLVSHVEGRNGDLQSALNEGVAVLNSELSAAISEFNSRVDEFDSMIADLTPFVTTDTDYTAL